jgi:hypothetical protein
MAYLLPAGLHLLGSIKGHGHERGSEQVATRITYRHSVGRYRQFGVADHAWLRQVDEIKKRGYMVVATNDFQPFEFVQDGKPPDSTTSCCPC